MLKPIDMTIFVFVYLLFVAGITCAVEIKSLQLGTSGTIPCDHVENDPEVRLVQWYKSRRNDEFENGDPSLASWANGKTGSLPNYHIENTTFSLVIENTTLEDEGLYKCSMEKGDLFTESYYNIRTVMYALPRMDPKIILDPILNRVNCTVEHVKPLIYPEFNFDHNHASAETYAVLNKDGTYTTSVSYTLPQKKSASRVECSFSYLHYRRVASLDLPDTSTDSLIEDKTNTISPFGTYVTFEGDGCTCITVGHQIALFVGVIGSFVMVAAFLLLLFMMTKLWRKHHRREQKCNEAKESEEKMRMQAQFMD